MKNLSRIFTLCFFVLLSCASSPKRSADPASNEKTSFTLPQSRQTTLANGLRIIWIEDQALPYISLQMMVRSGSANDPIGREGLAYFTSELLDKGTKSRSATRIADDLGQLATSFNTGVDSDYMFMSLDALSFHKDKALKEFSDILFNPTFPNAEIERQRKQVRAGLTRLADRAEDFVEFLVPQFLYGKHPYGHNYTGNLQSTKLIRRSDIQKFYNSQFTPGNSVLAVVGKFDGEFEKAVVSALEGWKSKTSQPFPVPAFPEWSGLQSLLIDRGDLQQAQIQILFKGVSRDIPEYLQLRAALKILGESFGSRLMDEIRTKRGLTYGINAWFEPRQQPGPMGIYTFTRTDKIQETINESLAVYRKFVEGGITDQELEDTRELMRGQFPRMFETKEAVAKQLLILDRYGIGTEYLTNYFENLNKMTKEDVNRTIAKYFDPKNIRIVVYAPKDKALATLKALGTVEVKDYREFIR